MLARVGSRRFILRVAASCLPLALLSCAGAGTSEVASPGRADLTLSDVSAGAAGASSASCPAVKHEAPPQLLKCSFVAEGASPRVDDFNDQDLLISPAENRSGRWYTFTDQTAGCIDLSVASSPESAALHVSGGGFSRWGAGFGVSLAWSAEAGGLCSYDLSNYSGIRFKARGHANLRLTFRTSESIFQSAGGDCPDADGCFDEYGKSFTLTADFKQFEVPFCTLAQQGWGTPLGAFNPSHATNFNFRVDTKKAFDVWIEDVEFTPRQGSQSAACANRCPRDELATDIQPKPSVTTVNQQTTGVQLFTFEQPTPDCGPLTRRYLAYKPKALSGRTDAPVVIVLHGRGADAEAMRSYMTQARFERLADRDGFVVVYGNAAPGVGTARERPNGGAFRTERGKKQQVDDLGYLRQIITDLTARGTISGKGPVFLAGLSNGGGLAHLAALDDAARYQGIAEVMPYPGYQVDGPKPAIHHGLKRLFLAYTINDPGLPTGYHAQLQPLGQAWAAALQLTQSNNSLTKTTALADRVVEGATYSGSNAVALATRNSHGQQLDYGGDSLGPLVRVIEFDRAGHFWPVPSPAYDDARIVAEFGLRNRDMDMSDAIWEFFRTSLSNETKSR